MIYELSVGLKGSSIFLCNELIHCCILLLLKKLVGVIDSLCWGTKNQNLLTCLTFLFGAKNFPYT
jgi:hypothetical protein